MDICNSRNKTLIDELSNREDTDKARIVEWKINLKKLPRMQQSHLN